MEYAIQTDIGDRKRDTGINEDSALAMQIDTRVRDASSSVGLFAIADGAGGADAGDVASRYAIEKLTAELTGALRNYPTLSDQNSEPELENVPSISDIDPELPKAKINPQELLKQTIQEIHNRLVNKNESDGNTRYTTLVAGLLINGRLHYAWVGDSRIYIINSKKKTIEQLTTDHSVVAEKVREGEIDQLTAFVHPKGNKITRAVGASTGGEGQQLTVETNSMPVYAEDRLLFTSDGLVDAWTGGEHIYRELRYGMTNTLKQEILGNSVTDVNIRELVLQPDSLGAVAEECIGVANERGGKDNLSVVVAANKDLPETPVELEDRSAKTDREESGEVVVEDETTLIGSHDDQS